MGRNGYLIKLATRGNAVGMQPDRGQMFAGVNVGRTAAGALIDAGYSSLADLPADLEELKELHGIGPKAIRLLRTAREQEG